MKPLNRYIRRGDFDGFAAPASTNFRTVFTNEMKRLVDHHIAFVNACGYPQCFAGSGDINLLLK